MSRLRRAGVLTALLMVQLAAGEDFLDLTPKGQTAKKSAGARKTRAPHLGLTQSPFENFGTTYNSFIASHTPIVFRPQPQPQPHPVYGVPPTPPNNPFPCVHAFGFNAPNVQQPVTCGDRFDGQCQKSRYRTLDGSCNNVYNPTWGQANTRYARLIPANYADGVHAPTRSVTGLELPQARVVSLTLFPDVKIEDKMWTLAAMQWGQIVTHDMAMIDGTTQSKAHPTRCCTDDGQFLVEALGSPLCYPIIVPNDDPAYGRTGTKCMNFVRSRTDLDRGCSSQYEPAEQLSVVTHFLDLSLVYGSNDQTLAGLRDGIRGRMAVEVRRGREWPPTATNKSALCDTQNEFEACYQTGDVRVNQNPQLTILQIILLREHNRVAEVLAHINPHWDDETVFQEARRIVIAEHQHITYHEYLPIFLGLDNLLRHKIIYNTKDYVNDYDPTVNPNVLNDHSNAAFRYFHSLIAGRLQLVNEHRFALSQRSLRLSDYLNRPGIIEEEDNMDDLTRGLATQPEEASDQFFDSEVTQFLFRNGQPFGVDLRAIDIQRNRDHGLASYNEYRSYCGLPKALQWGDFTDFISRENVEKLARLYETPDDVDLTVGGSLEAHVNGALAGPTFLCILHEQFYRTRTGDRFWYESGDHDTAFTIEQLNEIRKASISRFFCDNGDNIQFMQPRGFEIPSDSNALRKCEDLPALDLSLWKDYTPQPAAGINDIYSFHKK